MMLLRMGDSITTLPAMDPANNVCYSASRVTVTLFDDTFPRSPTQKERLMRARKHDIEQGKGLLSNSHASMI